MNSAERILTVLCSKFEEQAKLARQCSIKTLFPIESLRYQTAETVFRGIAEALNKARMELK